MEKAEERKLFQEVLGETAVKIVVSVSDKKLFYNETRGSEMNKINYKLEFDPNIQATNEFARPL